MILFVQKQVTENSAVRPETNVGGSTGDEESSYSSFYSSFLKTDTGSGSNEDNNNPEVKSESVENKVELFLFCVPFYVA